jgi:hypothetical protein
MVYAFLIAPIRLTCLTDFILLDLITLIKFDEEHKLRSCSSRNSPNLPITSSPGFRHSRQQNVYTGLLEDSTSDGLRCEPM